MFKILKSKKGFTLVELMIVVVIMAILVAVAVPIYSAVTKNARAKTCIANMREIVSQVANYAMSNNKTITETFKMTCNADKDGCASVENVGAVDPNLDVDTFKTLFQEVPYCPAGGDYTVVINDANIGSEEAGSVSVKITCADADNNESATHVYGSAS